MSYRNAPQCGPLHVRSPIPPRCATRGIVRLCLNVWRSRGYVTERMIVAIFQMKSTVVSWNKLTFKPFVLCKKRDSFLLPVAKLFLLLSIVSSLNFGIGTRNVVTSAHCVSLFYRKPLIQNRHPKLWKEMLLWAAKTQIYLRTCIQNVILGDFECDVYVLFR